MGISVEKLVLVSAILFVITNAACSPSVDQLITDLKNPNYNVRIRAIKSLGEIGDAKAVAPLLEVLYSSKDVEREQASLSLAKIGDEGIVDSLISVFSGEDSRTKANAAYAMGKIGNEQAVPYLIEALRDTDARTRVFAAFALGEIGDARAVGQLMELLSEYSDHWVLLDSAERDNEHIESGLDTLYEHEWFLCQTSYQALTKIGETAVSPLVSALSDGDFYVRGTAAAALGDIGSEQAVPLLIEALGDSDSYVRNNAVEALGKIGSTKAVQPLIDMLQRQDSYPPVYDIALALGEIGDAQAVKPLLQALEEAQGVKITVIIAEALYKIGDSRAFIAFDRALSEHDYGVIVGAYQYFIRKGQRGSEGVLIAALNECGHAGMAQAFINCGNKRLESGANEWARTHGYVINSATGNSGIRWGRKN